MFCVGFRCTAMWLESHVAHRAVSSASSPHLAPYMRLSISLTAFPVPQPLFCNYLFVLPNPFAPFTQAPKPVSLCSVSMSPLLFCWFVAFVQPIPHGRDIRWHVSCSDWLTSLSMIFRVHPCYGTELLLQSQNRTCESHQLSDSN